MVFFTFFFFIGNKSFIKNLKKAPKCIKYALTGGEWFSLQVGISVAAREYDLNSAAPFQTSDILNLQPVVKHSVPFCSEAKDLVETGKIQLAEV